MRPEWSTRELLDRVWPRGVKIDRGYHYRRIRDAAERFADRVEYQRRGPTKTMRGRATVQDGGKTTTVPLEPAAPNMMVGKLQAPLGSKARVVFTGNLHGHSLVARYVTE